MKGNPVIVLKDYDKPTDDYGRCDRGERSDRETV